MHGTVYRDSESCRSLRRSSSQHMRSVLQFLHSDTSRINLAAAGNHHSSIVEATTTNITTNDFFLKDGRKVSVGDCALFKPSLDSPPFIGLIRCLKFKEDKSLHLGVNWLYRPTELKLGKGNLSDSAPNEIFYSFHEDKTPAASLLHPCKVAFLPRGVELPTGTWSYVCRRVYDITNKCVWWLTDQDYINERQAEVDLLLHKTRTEMHATLQPGERSPKQVNSPSSTAKLKPGCDGGQNGGSSFSSHVKGKKRDRGDYGADTVKRERSSRHDDGDSIQCKSGTNLKSDIARIIDNGGVTDLDGVEKLIHLMQSNKTERSRDLLTRSMLAGVVAATDKVDCLNGFVQMRGLPVLDEWLQDIHKGKIGDGYSLKDGDKSVEEFVLILLRALDKLPVNLKALQMCNIGRSVNHLRSHKNLEIQRKARSLVDTWKKRVEAEMISIDTKSGSTQGICVWPSKSRLSEASHAGSRTPSGSEVAMKGSVTQNSTSKTTSARSSHGESNIKSATSSPEPLKSSSSPASGKEMQPRVSVGGTSDVPLIREDRSSSSNEPNSCNQSFSGKEDGKISAGLTSVSKVSSISTRNRKTSGFSGGSGSGSLKETSSGRVSSAHKSILEKSQSISSERVLEWPISEGNSHKLIVKIPVRVRSPPPVVREKSQEDPSFINNNTSSEVLLYKHGQFDQTSKDRSDAHECNIDSDMNVESWQSSDLKDLLVESGEIAESPTTFPDEEQSMTAKDSPTNKSFVSKHDVSFNPMNALIESCVKHSVGNSSSSLEDEVGMNLLASVATREVSGFDVVSPTTSTETSRHAVAENSFADELKLKFSRENHISLVRNETNIDEECDGKKQATVDGSSLPEDRLYLCKKASSQFDGDIQCTPFSSEDVQASGAQQHTISSNTDPRKAESELKTNDKSNEKTVATSPKFPVSTDKVTTGQFVQKILRDNSGLSNTSVTFDCKNEEISATMTEERTDSCLGDGNLTVEIKESNKMLKGDDKKDSNEGMDMGPTVQWKVNDIDKPEFSEKDNNANLPQSSHCRNTMLYSSAETNLNKIDENNTQSCIDKPNRPNFDCEVSKDANLEIHRTGFCFISNDLIGHKETNVEKTEDAEHASSMNPETHGKAKFDGSMPVSIQLDGTEKCSLSVAEICSSITKEETDPSNKIKFDLNEGFSVDDGKYGDPVNLISSLSTTVQISNLVPISLNSVSDSHSASITVTAAAKGPFVPPEDLMRSKGELGWKGSAVTSAFRPAEPRKCPDTLFGSTNMSYSDASTSNKNARILLDIDLNVPDDRVLEEMALRESALAVDSTTDFVSKHATSLDEAHILVRGSGGLDLDLNRVDDTNDHTYFALGTSLHKKNFDLNDGSVVDNASAEHLSTGKKVKGSIPSQLPTLGLGMNNPGVGSFPSWFPTGNTYSTVAIPSILPDRVDQLYPVFPPNASPRTFSPIGVAPFTHDLYRGPVLSSSPAVPFPPNHFQFPVFPFGTTFPLPSATFSGGANSYTDSSGARFFAPPVNPQFLGPVGSVTSQYARPYLVNFQDNSSNVVLENDRKWGRPGLDLNAGPGTMETEVREESSIQHSVAISQAVAEEHSLLHPASGSLSKRKEPEGGLDNESNRYKQFSWQ